MASAAAIFKAIGEVGGEALFVGGAVRDWVSGKPITDIDIATTLVPPRTLECLRRAGIRKVGLAGVTYGTVAIQQSRQSKVEVTTLRRDVATYGRAAKVEFGSDWQRDAERRDFTFNALYATASGDIYDPFGGIADLKGGVVKFIGDAERRILEDHLRILRFFRFFGGYGRGKADVEALAACVKYKHKLGELSGERIFAELGKMLMLKDPTEAITLMDEAKITPLISDKLTERKRLSAYIKGGFGGGVIPRLAAWLAKDADIKRLVARLRVSKRQAEELRFIHATGFDPLGWRLAILSAPEAAVKGWAGLLCAADEITGADYERIIAALPTPELPIGGDDLRKLGFTPSPQLGAVLFAVKKWWAANGYEPDRAACIDYAKGVAK